MTFEDSVSRRQPTSLEFLNLFRESLEVDGWRAAATLIESHWDYFLSSQPDVLLDAIKVLPGEALVETPGLLIGADYLKHVISGADPRVFRRNADIGVGDRGGFEGLRERLIAITGRIADHRSAGRIVPAIEESRRARLMLHRASSDDRAAIRAALPHLTVQWARSFDLADNSLALSEYEDTYDLALVTAQPHAARRAAGSLAWMHADRGSTGAAELWLARARSAGDPQPRYDIPQYLAAALLALHRLDLPTAEFELTAAQSVEPGEYWAALLWLRALWARLPLDAELLQQELEGEIARHPPGLALHGANRRYLTAARWRLGLALGTPIAALKTDEFEDGTPGELELELAYRRGDHAGALLSRAVKAGEALPTRQRASALLISAACRLRLGRESSAVEEFAKAYTIIEHERLQGMYALLRPEDLRELGEKSGHRVDDETLARLGGWPGAALPDIPKLTPREVQVLQMLLSTRSSAQIATELFISPNTLKSLVRRLYKKLGVNSRQKAIDVAHGLGFDPS
jgi:DNA-binding CsgD family transcriptional regulator